ncbi:hypothetical protein CFC21_017229 [Triticum aestivum]|uniref:Uncharacterized protein n=2 Tax=Triticum aestivum TaxID=4565 RepID=A0A3B6AZK6_WHEAT|nr:hypothetical protein CFC21_017229 [Triticum aestivum]
MTHPKRSDASARSSLDRAGHRSPPTRFPQPRLWHVTSPPPTCCCSAPACLRSSCRPSPAAGQRCRSPTSSASPRGPDPRPAGALPRTRKVLTALGPGLDPPRPSLFFFFYVEYKTVKYNYTTLILEPLPSTSEKHGFAEYSFVLSRPPSPTTNMYNCSRPKTLDALSSTTRCTTTVVGDPFHQVQLHGYDLGFGLQAPSTPTTGSHRRPNDY